MCVAASGHSARDIWMTFTVSTCQVSGFTRSVTRRYLPRSNALRVSHRVLTATRRRRATMSPFRRHVDSCPCRRQPWMVHAHERLDRVSSTRNKFLYPPPLSVAYTCVPYEWNWSQDVEKRYSRPCTELVYAYQCRSGHSCGF